MTWEGENAHDEIAMNININAKIDIIDHWAEVTMKCIFNYILWSFDMAWKEAP